MRRILFSLLIIGLLIIITTNVLGKHNLKYINNPSVKPVSDSDNLVKHIGLWNSILITKVGKVYVWGSNGYGQLGLGDTNNRNTPTENTNLENIIHNNNDIDNVQGLYIGVHHNILIFDNGKVYVWGYNDQGELGLGYSTTSSPYGITTPTENTKIEKHNPTKW